MSDQPRPKRRATPRPVYTEPTVVSRSAASHHLWGDATAGLVTDRVYLSSDLLHVLEFSLPPGGGFGHSPDNPTVFGADELYYVLEGALLVTDPSTGEAHRAVAGEGIFFGKDTWHHGRASGDTGVRVLEFFAPTPAQGASSEYARTQPYLDHVATVDERILGRWPTDAAEVRAKQRMTRLGERDLAWATCGALELAFFAATDDLTVARCHLRAGAAGPAEQHRGDKLMLLEAGRLTIETPTSPSQNCLCLEPGDAAVLPANTPHRCHSMGDEQAVWITGVGPGWTSAADIGRP